MAFAAQARRRLESKLESKDKARGGAGTGMPKGLWFPARWIRCLFALEETPMLVSPLTPHPVRPSSVVFFLPSLMHSGAQVTGVERCVGDEELVWGTKLRR